MPTHGEMIDNISRQFREPFTVEELANAIVRKYGSVRRIDRRSLKTDILGCCVNLKSHRSLPDSPLVLVSLGGRGERRLLRRHNPATDRHLNLYLESEEGGPLKPKNEKETTPSRGRVRAFYYDFKGAKRRLLEKGLLSEIHQIVRSIGSVDHGKIQEAFRKRGWLTEYRIHHEANWAWDAYKDKIPVSIELSLIDAVHRDFLRLLLWEREGKAAAMVYITATESKEVKFENVKRDLRIFSSLIDTPVLLVGLKPD